MIDLNWSVLLVILVLISIDYVTGIIGAVTTDTFTSEKMRRGLWHKLSYIIALIVAYCVDYLCAFMELGYIYGASLIVLVMVWIVITEVGSILENLCVINPNFGTNAFMRIFMREAQDKEMLPVEGIVEEIPESREGTE